MTANKVTHNLVLIVLSFVLCHSMQGQTTTTNTDCSLNGNTASCTSTSTSDAAQIAQQQAQQAERDKQLNDMGNAIGAGISNAMLRHKVKKDVEKYCGQHPGEPWTWQVNGQPLSGVCPGELPVALARQRFIDGQRRAFLKNGVAGYAEFSGDTLIIHSERASAIRFHAGVSDVKFLTLFRSMNANTYIYTNDADQRFEFDVAHNREVTPDSVARRTESSSGSIATAVTGSLPDVTVPSMAVTAATVAPATPPQAEAQTIQLGQTPGQVRAALGQPDDVVNLGAKQIYLYKNLKVTFVGEKVSDVQ
jgi:hypothetical protein